MAVMFYTYLLSGNWKDCDSGHMISEVTDRLLCWMAGLSFERFRGDFMKNSVLVIFFAALLTLAFFLFNGPVIELESQVVRGLT